jgi:hypothetical protein
MVTEKDKGWELPENSREAIKVAEAVAEIGQFHLPLLCNVVSCVLEKEVVLTVCADLVVKIVMCACVL